MHESKYFVVRVRCRRLVVQKVPTPSLQVLTRADYLSLTQFQTFNRQLILNKIVGLSFDMIL